MKLDEFGLPLENATDKQDSCRLAGVMRTFKHPMAFDISKYVISYGQYCRHPKEFIYKQSRDQTVPLFAGLFVDGLNHLVDSNYSPPSGDWISPSVRGHFKRCAGLKANWFQDLWLWLDVLWSCFIDPMAESNQLICLMKVHPNKAYLKFWCKWNKKWKNSIKNYWCENEGAWRGEPELAEIMIKTIEEDVK